jgi:aminomethyltransferase
MADFGGFDMPLWYSSVKEEHLAVLTGAGIFDTSHMAAVMVTGPASTELLQYCFTNDLAACLGPARKPLAPGRCVYGAFLEENGFTIDDAIVYHLSDSSYMVVVNAGMGRSIADHLEKWRDGRNAAVTDLTGRIGKMDIQGPASAKVLSHVLEDPKNVFASMPYFSFKGRFDNSPDPAGEARLDDGTPLLLSRTGYTGEFGFEIFLEPDKLENLWLRLLEAGETYGLHPCGLAARDSLRAGAVLPLSHQDIGPWPFMNHPWSFALPYTANHSGFTKDFIGRRALENLKSAEFTHAFVGRDLRKVSAGEGSRVMTREGDNIGTVLTCATDMGIGIQDGKILSVASPDKPADFNPRGLCCGFVKVSIKLPVGRQVDIADGRRTIPVTIVNDIRPHRTARRPMADMI